MDPHRADNRRAMPPPSPFVSRSTHRFATPSTRHSGPENVRAAFVLGYAVIVACERGPIFVRENEGCVRGTKEKSSREMERSGRAVPP